MEEMTQGTTAAQAASGWRRADPAWLVLALLPWLLAAADSRWLYNPLRSIDPWVYFGYSLDYPRYVTDLFPGLYYGTRLSWILPGYLLYSLFDVVLARYLLHFGLYYLAVFSLYGLLRRAVGPRSALLGAVLFGAHSYFLRAIGWDYIDGPGLTYNLLGVACLIRAAESRRAWFWLMLCGMAGAAMFYCNIFLVVFLPLLPAFYLYQNHRGFTWHTARMALGFLLWFGLGALLVSGLLEIVNYSVTGSAWFYSQSFQFVRDMSSKPSPWRFKGGGWVRVATWLGIPASAALASIVYVLLHARYRTFSKRDLRLLFVLYYLGYVAIMIAWHVAGGIGLQWPFYTSYLLPPVFLAIGCMLGFSLESWTALRYWLLLAAVALSFAASLALYTGNFTMHLLHIGWWNVALCVALGLVIGLLWRRWQILLVILCALWFYQTGFRPTDWHVEPMDRASFLRVTDSLKLIREHTGEAPLKFWYNLHEPSGDEFNAINSAYLWGYTMISQDFPAFPPVSPPEIGATGVILSNRNDALQQANQALHSSHLEARKLAARRIDRNGVSYQLLFFDVQALGTERQLPLKLSLTPGRPMQLAPSSAGDSAALPKEQWVLCYYPHSKARLELRQDGVVVTTHDTPYAYGAKYGPLTVVKTGNYRFVLNYKIIDGGLVFGILSGDESHWMSQSAAAHKTRGNGTRIVALPLKAGERVFLLVTNTLHSGSEQSSTFLIRSVQAFGSFGE